MSSVNRRAKRIWIVNRFATPPDAPGGTRHYDFGVELAKRGYEVAIFAADLNYMLREARADEFSEGRLRFVWIRSLRYERNNWRRAVGMLSFAFNVITTGVLLQRPDVIIGSSPHLFGALAGYILARLKNSRFYLEVRDLWPQTLIDMRKQEKRGSGGVYAVVIMVLRMIEALLYRKADRIIVLSKGAEKYIIDRGISREKLSFLPNGVYLEQFRVSESRASVRDRLGLADRFVVMYAGAHGIANALDIIIRSAEIISASDRSDVTFVLVGDGPSRDELLQMVRAKNLSNVKMLPAVPKAVIPDLLNAADALVITLRAVELFSYGVSPNKLFEYMASGKPVLCAVSGDVADMITQSDAGVAVEPENPEALSQAILDLMGDKDKCLIYGANGRNFVEENFSRSRIAKRLISMIDFYGDSSGWHCQR